MSPIDELDLKILSVLVDNSKATLKNIGEKVGLHPNVVAYRIKRLEQRGVIQRHTVQLNLEKLGLGEHVYVSASFPDFDQRDGVLKEIFSIPQICRVMSLLGLPGLMIFIVGKDKAEVDGIITRLRNLNVKVENATSIVKVYQDWLPGYLFNELATREILKNSPEDG